MRFYSFSQITHKPDVLKRISRERHKKPVKDGQMGEGYELQNINS